MNRQLLPTEQVTKQQLERLRQKYARENQNLFCHLERLIHETTINYSDYLNIDTLLTLQKPRTAFPDELIFISYHQIVELFFRLIRWELEQLTDERTDLPPDVFADKVQRINRYFRCVIDSFDIMANGLDKKQFVQFRYALFPASGFQSLQYRMIELWATDAPNLVSRKWRSTIHNQSPAEELYAKMYWKRGAVEATTGGKSVTLTDFEHRYDRQLLQHLDDTRERNLNQTYWKRYAEQDSEGHIKEALRDMDQLANIHWQMAHYRVAMKHLTSNKSATVPSTGGTNWRKYLHPRFQLIIFFPKLWSASELEEWGRID